VVLRQPALEFQPTCQVGNAIFDGPFRPGRHLLVDVEEPAHFEPEVRKREKARMAILFGTATAVLQQQARRLPKCQWPTYHLERTHGPFLSLRYETRLVGPPPKPTLILIEIPPFGR